MDKIVKRIKTRLLKNNKTNRENSKVKIKSHNIWKRSNQMKIVFIKKVVQNNLWKNYKTKI